MDKAIDTAISILAVMGGVLVTSGLVAPLPIFSLMGIPPDREVLMGFVLGVTVLAAYAAMGGRLNFWRR